MNIRLLILLSILSTTLSFSKSKSYVGRSGYSHLPGQSGSYYQPPAASGIIQRYLYSAFQRGYTEGNLKVNLKNASFLYEPLTQMSSLVLSDPGQSRLDIYFSQNRNYRVHSMKVSILERLFASQIGRLRITMNGRNIIAHHSPRFNRRFDESTWDISGFFVPGLNHLEIELEHNGGGLALLGVKVETRESRLNAGQDQYANLQFVNRVFRRYHQRFPTPEESSYYLDLLNHGLKGRSEVSQMIRDLSQNLDEYQSLVADYFLRYARRPASSEELQRYADKLRSGQINLPQLKSLLERLAGTDPIEGTEQRISRLFRELIQRTPTHEELRYYSDKIRQGALSWEQVRHEVLLLRDDSTPGFGLSQNEILALRFTEREVTAAFWAKLRLTPKHILRILLRRAQYMQMNGATPRVKTVAGQIFLQIKTLYPSLKY
jgi:hypothetical protein